MAYANAGAETVATTTTGMPNPYQSLEKVVELRWAALEGYANLKPLDRIIANGGRIVLTPFQLFSFLIIWFDSPWLYFVNRAFAANWDAKTVVALDVVFILSVSSLVGLCLVAFSRNAKRIILGGTVLKLTLPGFLAVLGKFMLS